MGSVSSGPTESERAPTRVVVVAVALTAFAASFAFLRSSVDDSFITLRYARNLVEGHGPVFNIGDRVEGFTSPLHLLMATVSYLLPGAYNLFQLKLVSVGMGLTAMALWVHVAWRVFEDKRLAFGAIGLTAVSYPVATASTNGLETGTLLLLVTSLVWLSLDEESLRGRGVLFGALGALAVLTRPDAALIVGGLLIWLLVRQRRTGVVASIVAVGPVLAYQVFRMAYFGELLPNTFYAKRLPLWGPSYILRRLYAGREQIFGRHPRSFGPIQIGVLNNVRNVALAVLLVVGFVGAYVLVRRKLVPLVIVVVAQSTFILWSGGDWMYGRFLAPMWPSLLILFVAGFAQILTSLVRSGLWPLRVAVAALVAAALLFTGGSQWNQRIVAPYHLRAVNDRDLLRYARSGPFWTNVAALVSCVEDGDMIAFTEAGYLSYVNPHLSLLDTRGLNDKAIARAPGPLHDTVGVFDPDWSNPNSFIGRQILRRRPVLVFTYDGYEDKTAFGGAYVRAGRYPSREHFLVRYRRADVVCPGQRDVIGARVDGTGKK